MFAGGCVADYLFEDFDVFEVAGAAEGGYPADGLRAIFFEAFGYFDQLCFDQDL